MRVAGGNAYFYAPFSTWQADGGAFAECQGETAGKSKCAGSGEKCLGAFGRNNIFERGGKFQPCLLTCGDESERETGMLAICAEAGP